MIPKIIHYCWFGGNPLPPLAQKCIKSWKKYCPDYEIVRWDESNFDINGSLGQFTRNYTQTVKRAADNKRRYAPGEGSIPPVLLSGVSKGVPPLAHDFACKV